MVVGAALDAIWGFYGEVFSSLHPVFWVYVPYWTLIVSALFLSPLTVLLPQYLKGELRLENPFKKVEEPDVWIVHGRKYNLKPFMKIHPGGEFVIRAARGSDITGLFESYHIFIEREVLLRMLDRFEIVEEGQKKEPLRVPVDPFHEDLKQMVRDHFKGQPKGAHKMTTSHLAMCGLCWLCLMYLTFVMLTQDALWTIPLIGFCTWYLTGNVMHDASHNALVRNPRLNRLAGYMAFPWCINITSWHIQHVVSHHVHTNDTQDVDLYHFNPLIILRKGVCTVHEALHLLRLGLLCSTVYPHLTLVVPYGLVVGQVDPAHGHRMYDQFSDMQKYRRQLRGDIALEIACLLAYFCLVYCVQGFTKGICFYLSASVVSSYLFSFFTQVSHLQEECFLDEKERAKLSFMQHQVSTSMDFSADSAFWGHISGGLNTQAIHHCMPPISAMHLRSLYPKFREVCRKHGVELKEAQSLSAFVWGFIQVAN